MFEWEGFRFVDVFHRTFNQHIDRGVIVLQEVGLVVVVEGGLEVEAQVVRVAQGHVRLGALRVDRQALFVGLDGGGEVLHFALAVGQVEQDRLVYVRVGADDAVGGAAGECESEVLLRLVVGLSVEVDHSQLIIHLGVGRV